MRKKITAALAITALLAAGSVTASSTDVGGKKWCKPNEAVGVTTESHSNWVHHHTYTSQSGSTSIWSSKTPTAAYGSQGPFARAKWNASIQTLEAFKSAEAKCYQAPR